MTTSRSPELRIAAIALALLGACSKFDAESSAPTDGGVVTTPDGGSKTAEAGTGDVCGGLPLETFATTEDPAGWTEQGVASTGEMEITSASYFDAQGNYLHASVTSSTDVPDAPTLIGPPLAIAKHVRLEYDLAVKKPAHYGELGCELELWGPTAVQDKVVLYVGVERATGVSLIAGWNYDSSTSGKQSDETALLTGWQLGKWQHVAIDATIDGSNVSAQFSIDGGVPTTIHPPTASYTFKELHVRCGVLFFSPVPSGVEQTMDVGIDNITVSACGP